MWTNSKIFSFLIYQSNSDLVVTFCVFKSTSSVPIHQHLKKIHYLLPLLVCSVVTFYYIQFFSLYTSTYILFFPSVSATYTV
jgi:hypothetical protein